MIQQMTFWNIFLIFPGKYALAFMQIVSLEENLHEMSKPILWEK